ncbi:uncharacterized protein G2W53_040137 [Senna tora]|uniref:Uncharacterized protein n=1 Tax=Senna tora TaxID=362788 RepID=A0A834SR28_9FABA|nr:uncharacterized protein G2W53_040137 [Senna tora]
MPSRISKGSLDKKLLRLAYLIVPPSLSTLFFFIGSVWEEGDLAPLGRSRVAKGEEVVSEEACLLG